MKYSQVLISALFGSMAAAVPFKRDLFTKTEVAYETVVVYTTVWDDGDVAAATTTAGGYFYEQPTEAAPTTTPAAASSPAPESSSVYTPPAVETPTPTPTSAVVVPSAAPAAEAVESSSAAPAPAAPTTTEAASSAAPTSAAPATTTAAAASAAQASSSSSDSTGESFTGVDLTINPLTGALGACGEPMHATDMYVAIAESAWGASTYNTMTGAATNKWCGQKIRIEYNGKSVDAKIMDMCPGCAGHDLDLSDAAWAAIGMTEWTRVQGSWSIIN